MRRGVILSACLSIIVTAVAFGQPGVLDNTFGMGGIVTTSIGTSYLAGRAMTMQPDGKILVAGNYSVDGVRFEFALIRYNANGTLDTTFGTKGVDTTVIDSFDDVASAIAIQTDGKIIVAGSSNDSLNNKFSVVRYLPTGDLDTTFGIKGKVATIFGNTSDNANALAIQQNGKIILAGSLTNDSITEFAVVRYSASGVLDTTFGDSGLVVTAIGVGDDEAFSVVIQPDGKIVAAGASLDTLNYDFALARYDSTGAPDSSFGINGIVTTDIENYDDAAFAIALQSDGKIVATGRAFNGVTSVYTIATVRYTTNGSLDASFADGGKDTTSIGGYDDEGLAVAIQPTDGKIVIAGFADINTNDNFAVVRYNTNGSPDTTSNGGNGKVTTAIDSVSTGQAVVIQPDGKIVVAGYSQNFSSLYYNIAVVRYLTALTLGVIDLGKDDNSVFVYPNPVGAKAVLDYTISNAEILSISIYDLTGRLMQDIITNQIESEGAHQQILNLQLLPPGMYVLSLSNAKSQSVYVKIIKQ